jgi:prevent-host-death family protein
VGRAAHPSLLLHEMFDRVALVDDQVPLVLLHYVLDLSCFVAGYEGEPVALAADGLVLGEGHQHASFASPGRTAFALEREPLLWGGPPARALVGGCDPVVDRAHQVFVPSLPLEPLLHERILGRSVIAFRAASRRKCYIMCVMERVGVRELRQNLSVYLRRVKRGERLEVTERGSPVARLEPIVDEDDPLARLEANGLVIRRGRGSLADLPPPLRVELERPLSELLEELREERL